MSVDCTDIALYFITCSLSIRLCDRGEQHRFFMQNNCNETAVYRFYFVTLQHRKQ